MPEQSLNALDRDVLAEALALLEAHADSELYRDASDQMCADHSLAASLLRGELEGEHTPAARAASEVLKS